MTNAQSGGGPERPEQGIPSTEEDMLHTERDETRRELGETIDALASKADLPSRSQQVAHGYIIKAQDGATALARSVRHSRASEVVRHSRASEMTWLPPALLAAALVALASALVRAKMKTRSRGRRRSSHRGHGRR